MQLYELSMDFPTFIYASLGVFTLRSELSYIRRRMEQEPDFWKEQLPRN